MVTAGGPLVLDPLLGRSDPASRDLARLTSRALLRLDQRVTPVPDLATTWGVSGDGLTYRFELTDSRRWSDGSVITAQDAAATVALVQRQDFPDTALAAAWKGIAVRVESDTAVTMTLPAARASFAATVADLPLLPTAEALQPTSTLMATARTPAPGSGPFVVASSDAATVRLVPNRQAVPRPRLNGIELRLVADFTAAARALATGQVDAVEATTPAERAAVSGLAGVQVHDVLSLRFVDLLLNTRRPGLNDLAVRRALASVVDRASLIRAAVGNAARAQVDAIPAGILWLGPGSEEGPNASLAARALDAAGWVVVSPGQPRSRAGQSLAFTLTVPDVIPLPAVGHELARQLASVGVAATVEAVPPVAFATGVLGGQHYDLAVADWDNGADPDVSAYWRSNATPPAGFNVSGLPADPFLDRALDSLATELDPQLRAEAANRVDQRLAEEVPAVFLYAPTTSFAVRASVDASTLPAAGSPAARYDGAAVWVRRPG